MRETSSRSLTSRTRWLIWRSMTALTRTATGSCIPVACSSCRRCQQRRQRIAQLVAERGQKLVLAPVGEPERFLGLSAFRQMTRESDIAGRARGARCGRRSRASPLRNGRSSSVTLPSIRTASVDVGGIRAGARQDQHGQVRPRRLQSRGSRRVPRDVRARRPPPAAGAHRRRRLPRAAARRMFHTVEPDPHRRQRSLRRRPIHGCRRQEQHPAIAFEGGGGRAHSLSFVPVREPS